MKVINCAKCNEEYAIDLNKPEEWYCPYCDNLYSSTTDKLSVEKLQERCDRYEKALINIKWRTERDELETYYVERNHDIHKDAIDALAAIGGDDD